MPLSRKMNCGYLAGFFVLIVLWMFLGCGYRFAGSGTYPAGVKRIFISILENRTTETGIEKIFTDDMVDEFIRRDETGLANDKNDADAVLIGAIESMSVETITHTGVYTSDTRRVILSVNLKLVDGKKRILWSGVITDNEAYDVADDKFATDERRRDAITVISKRMAEKFYNRLTADF